jgi:polysaccharide pyruvyl transferase CsaB
VDHAARVGISGSYGGLNLGDEAILHVIIRRLRESMPAEITVFSRNPEDTSQRHQVERAVPVRDLSRDEAREEVKRLDLLILGGGGILFDREIEIYLREVALAHEVGVPVMVYAVSAGPLDDADARKLVRTHLNKAAAITVRDRHGRRVLEEVGIQKEIRITADPALLLEPEPLPEDALKREGLDEKRRIVGFSVREPGAAAPDIDVNHYHALLANAADFMVDRYDADIVFVPMERQMMDPRQSHAVVSQMYYARRAAVLKGEYSAGQILSLIGHFDLAVGMRLHFLIFAAIQGVPFVALPYASKVKGFLEDLQIDTPPLEHVTTGRLISYIDTAWDLRHDLRGRVQGILPELQARARETNEVAAALLAERLAAERAVPG